MSGSAQVDESLVEDLAMEYAADVGEVLNVGASEVGHFYLCTHECPHCHSRVQTAGVGHPTLHCSYCESVRGFRKTEMGRKFECLEILE